MFLLISIALFSFFLGSFWGGGGLDFLLPRAGDPGENGPIATCVS